MKTNLGLKTEISLAKGGLMGAGLGIVFAIVRPVIFGEGPVNVPNSLPILLGLVLGGSVAGAFWGVFVVFLCNRFRR